MGLEVVYAEDLVVSFCHEACLGFPVIPLIEFPDLRPARANNVGSRWCGYQCPCVYHCEAVDLLPHCVVPYSAHPAGFLVVGWGVSTMVRSLRLPLGQYFGAGRLAWDCGD